MIISASYRTDIPAYFSEWFMNRLRAGYAKAVNPYGYQITTIPMEAEAVDGIVFWTKNFGPMLKYLDELDRFGVPFYVSYTITGYPRCLESARPEADRAIAHIRELCERYGRRAVVWRYDPMVCG